MATFRIHCWDGSKHDIAAETAKQASEIAAARKIGPVQKIKIVKETA